MVGEPQLNNRCLGVFWAHYNFKTRDRELLYISAKVELLNLRVKQQKDTVDKSNSQILPIRTEVEASGLSAKVLLNDTVVLGYVPNAEGLVVSNTG